MHFTPFSCHDAFINSSQDNLTCKPQVIYSQQWLLLFVAVAAVACPGPVSSVQFLLSAPCENICYRNKKYLLPEFCQFIPWVEGRQRTVFEWLVWTQHTTVTAYWLLPRAKPERREINKIFGFRLPVVFLRMQDGSILLIDVHRLLIKFSCWE